MIEFMLVDPESTMYVCGYDKANNKVVFECPRVREITINPEEMDEAIYKFENGFPDTKMSKIYLDFYDCCDDNDIDSDDESSRQEWEG
jgi:hypothetical protein